MLLGHVNTKRRMNTMARSWQNRHGVTSSRISPARCHIVPVGGAAALSRRTGWQSACVPRRARAPPCAAASSSRAARRGENHGNATSSWSW